MLEYPPILSGSTQQQLRELREYLVRRVRREETESPTASSARQGSDGSATALSARIDRTAGALRREYGQGQEQTGAWLAALLDAPCPSGEEPEAPAAPAAPAPADFLRCDGADGQLHVPGLSVGNALRLGNWLLSPEGGLGLRCLESEEETP